MSYYSLFTNSNSASKGNDAEKYKKGNALSAIQMNTCVTANQNCIV